MKVLVGCEQSGVVRDAFIACGHDAWSCDTQPSPGHHIQDDVLNHLNDGFDLLIGHPPCTYLSVSGMHWTTRGLRPAQLTSDAIKFAELLWKAPIHRIAIENPVGVLSTRSCLGKSTQIIQPWMFGHPESKATCLWLKNLPPLKATNVLPQPDSGYWSNQTPSGQNKLGPSPDRWMQRSRTYTGIANAMAKQWSNPANFPKHQEQLPLLLEG